MFDGFAWQLTRWQPINVCWLLWKHESTVKTAEFIIKNEWITNHITSYWHNLFELSHNYSIICVNTSRCSFTDVLDLIWLFIWTPNLPATPSRGEWEKPALPRKCFCSEISKEKHNKEKQVSETWHTGGGRGVVCKMSLQHWTSTTHKDTQSILGDMV